jgi:hypothetical protein
VECYLTMQVHCCPPLSTVLSSHPCTGWLQIQVPSSSQAIFLCVCC